MSSSAQVQPEPAVRGAKRLCFAAGVVAILVYFGARSILEMDSVETPVRWIAAIAPVPFFLFFLLAEIRLIRQLDEMEQRIQLEALAFAFPAVALLLMTLGLLELVTPLSPEDWSYRHVWIFSLALYGVGLALARRRYR